MGRELGTSAPTPELPPTHGLLMPTPDSYRDSSTESPRLHLPGLTVPVRGVRQGPWRGWGDRHSQWEAESEAWSLRGEFPRLPRWPGEAVLPTR